MQICKFMEFWLLLVQDLSEVEKQDILLSEDFHKFFNKTSRIIERALEEEIDFLVDYTGAGEDGEGFVDLNFFINIFMAWINVGKQFIFSLLQRWQERDEIVVKSMFLRWTLVKK